MPDLKRTPLTSWHAENGGKLVEFAGYSMPVQYQGVVAEHRAVRNHCGLFDVSHMAEFRLSGSTAREELNHLITNDAGRLARGQALYTALCRDTGTILDDLLVYCFDEDDFLVVANAANHDKVAAWIQDHLASPKTFRDETEQTALLALQGPKSLDVLRTWPRLASARRDLDRIEYYWCVGLELDGISVRLSRTGYTGEWGYELYLPAEHAGTVWTELLEAGQAAQLTPCGLGARDTLRLEAGFSLYGHELDEAVTPYESGIGWVVRLNKGDFVGRDALARQKDEGVPHRTLGLCFEGRNIARQGAAVLFGAETVGVVTSGTFSPTLQHGIALARVRADAVEGPLHADIRGRRADAEICRPPFVANRTRGES